MSGPARKHATYDDLYGIPDHTTGEIIDGEIIATPSPSSKHIHATSAVTTRVMAPYGFAEGGGPGGWIIHVEPEIGLGGNILVPDLAGWKKERFPFDRETNYISVPPDWVCEVLSPGTVRIDRTKKMRLYAEHGIPHLWLIDPLAEMVETFRLVSGRWMLLRVFAGDEPMRSEPFEEVEIILTDLWLRA